jgi:uncharacterized protein (TIGR00369 family)
MEMSEVQAGTRVRTITWDDPRTIAAAAHGKTGLEFLREVVAGRVPAPPMGRLMNIRLTVANRGEIVFEGTPEEYHYNPMGIVHGGMAATILDSALGCCVYSCLELGDVWTTLDIKVSYLKAMTAETGLVRAIATIVHVGRTVALAEARLVDANDVIFAHATSTCLIKRAGR